MILSNAQIEILKELNTNKKLMFVDAAIDCYWFITGSMKRIRYATFDKLLDRGFIEEIGKTEWGRGYCVITEKGEDFLNKNS